MNKTLMFIIVLCAFCQSLFAQSPADSVVTIYSNADGKETAICSGIIFGADGYILTPLHSVKNVNQISVKLRSGEIFDNAKIVNKDERRNVALLQIIAVGLKTLPNRSSEEPLIGAEITIISNASGETAERKQGILNGNQLADSIPGAGNGYRVFLFEIKLNENPVGGLLLDEKERPIGIITTAPNVKDRNIAVPFSSVSGLMNSINPENGVSTQNKESSINTPAVKNSITGTQSAVETKQVEVKEPTKSSRKLSSREVLETAKTIYVKSYTGFIKDPAFIAELMKNPDFSEWGWSFTNNRETADLILEVDRLPLVIKFTFKIYSIKHGVIIASGNTHTNDFDFGSPDMVREVIKRIKLQWAITK